MRKKGYEDKLSTMKISSIPTISSYNSTRISQALDALEKGNLMTDLTGLW